MKEGLSLLKRLLLMRIAIFSAFYLMAVASAQANTQQNNALPEYYQSLSALPLSQSRVIFFRSFDDEEGAAHIYINGEFHTSLLPGSFTAFCLAPGEHRLAALVKNASYYHGMPLTDFKIWLGRGETQFLRMLDGYSGEPEVLNRPAAEQELPYLQHQRRMLSRASSVEECSTEE